MNMTNRKNFTINVDIEYDDLVKKLTSVFDKTNKGK